LFDILVKKPERLPLRFRQRCERFGVEKVAGEYLAGMTDAFCDAQYQYATQSATGPLSDW
jgi:dGTPase